MIEREQRGAVGIVRILRHESRNALDREHAVALELAVNEALTDGARAVVITGDGSSFCAGADLSTAYDEGFRDSLYSMLQTVARAPVPVIAAVNGPAIGAGTQLAIACDLRVGAPTAVFGVPTAQLGIAVDPWTVRRLTALAGAGPAAGILLALDRLDVHRAHQIGLVDRLGDEHTAVELADHISTLAPLTLRYSKLALRTAATESHELIDELTAAYDLCWASDDAQEGARARGERRPPLFHGR